MRKCEMIAVLLGTAMLAGCTTVDTPLVFAKALTYGASVAATVPDQGGSVTLGYRSAHLAVVPVTARDASGNVLNVHATQLSNAQKSQEAFSTFAHFEANNGVPLKACLAIRSRPVMRPARSPKVCQRFVHDASTASATSNSLKSEGEPHA